MWIDLRFCIIELVLPTNFIVNRYLPGTAEHGRGRDVEFPACGVPGMWRSRHGAVFLSGPAGRQEKARRLGRKSLQARCGGKIRFSPPPPLSLAED